MDSSLSSDSGDSQSGGAQEICAPLDAFSVNGTPPAEGDEVEFKVKGTVSRVEGGNAYVEPETVNDSPVMNDSGGQGDSEPSEDALRQNAQNQDTQQYASGGVARMDQRGSSPRLVPDQYDPNVPFSPYGRKRSGGGMDRGAPHGG